MHSANGMLTARLPVSIGDRCDIHLDDGSQRPAEVVGFDGRFAQILPFESCAGVSGRAKVSSPGTRLQTPTGPALLGRVIDGLGRPIDGKGPVRPTHRVSAHNNAPSAMHRQRVQRPFATGQRVIDSMLTVGCGQRMGLFAGSGVGKSTLLGEIARGAESDMNVVALIGERGREVRPFLEDCLGAEGIAKSVTVVSTADQTPLMRVRAAETAIATATFFREQGLNVLLLLDSVTRVAMAQREIGLMLGEPPSSRGFTPSVFAKIATLLEQLGASERGTITGILTVLVDGDDLDEPIADCVRGIVDGHIVLSRRLAERSHFPAIDVSASVSRVFPDVASPDQKEAARTIRRLLAEYEDVAELIRIGAYKPGSAPVVDVAISLLPAINALLQQRPGEHTAFDDTVNATVRIAHQANSFLQPHAQNN